MGFKKSAQPGSLVTPIKSQTWLEMKALGAPESVVSDIFRPGLVSLRVCLFSCHREVCRPMLTCSCCSGSLTWGLEGLAEPASSPPRGPQSGPLPSGPLAQGLRGTSEGPRQGYEDSTLLHFCEHLINVLELLRWSLTSSCQAQWKNTGHSIRGPASRP